MGMGMEKEDALVIQYEFSFELGVLLGRDEGLLERGVGRDEHQGVENCGFHETGVISLSSELLLQSTRADQNAL